MIALSDITALVSDNLVKLIGGILILLIGLVISRFFGKLFYKVLHRIGVNEVLKKQLQLQIPIEEFISTFIRYLGYIISVIFALQQLGLTTFIFNLILILILVFIILMVVIALKDIVPNITAGFFITQKKLVKVGDIVKIKNLTGKVTNVTLTEIQIKNKEDIIIIPNSVLIKHEIIKKR
ncbi:MAG: mechanosensitive ion channel domain-containing protein [Candidatus Nanoarchaeia archaeon]